MKKIIVIFGFILVLAIGYLITSNHVEVSTTSDKDLNSNGIWDGVEEKVKVQFAGDPNRIKALFQLAKALQKSVSDEQLTEQKALDIDREMVRAQECLFQINPLGGDSLLLEQWIVNSEERSRRYIKFNSLLSGQVTKLDKTKSLCEFEIAK